MRSRLLIHAGFAKCGSASIRTALFRNFRKLQKDSVFVFDKELRLARTAADLIGTPIWCLEQARKHSENLTRRLSAEVAPLLKRKRQHLAILSAENLANPGMADLLAGLDSQCDVSVVFYLRPQLQWIPSAWKQWGLKMGASLSDFVAQCIDTHTPAFKRDIESWKSTLPAANIHVRFLSRNCWPAASLLRTFSICSAFQRNNMTLKAKPEIPVSMSRFSMCYRKIRIFSLMFTTTG